MSFHLKAPGVYVDSRTGNFYERPVLNGRQTWRKLNARTLAKAVAEREAKRTDHRRASLGLAADPYNQDFDTVARLAHFYLKDGCPDRKKRPRTGIALKSEVWRTEKLLEYFGKHKAEKINIPTLDNYVEWRTKPKKAKKNKGLRAAEMELTTLSNILAYAVRRGRLAQNPIKSRPSYHLTTNHCRDFAPVSTEEFHRLADYLLGSGRSQVLGWQLLLEGLTGCRTNEILNLRWDSKSTEDPGFIEGDWLYLNRSKGGVNPFALITPALSDCLKALKSWRDKRYPKSPWFLPSYRRPNDQHAEKCSLTHALKSASGVLELPNRTSHGLRSFYVTVRRSQGASDAQIAAEIGDRTGAQLIADTYGGVPPNWKGKAGLGWIPSDRPPAWEPWLPKTEKVLPINFAAKTG